MRSRNALALAGTAALALGAGVLTIPAFGAGSAATASHTIQFVPITKSSHDFAGYNGGVQFDTDMHAGKVIGYDVIDFGTPFGANGGSVAFATRGGDLYGRLSFSQSGAGTGKVTGGSGDYRGAAGTITISPGKTPHVTLIWHR